MIIDVAIQATCADLAHLSVPLHIPDPPRQQDHQTAQTRFQCVRSKVGNVEFDQVETSTCGQLRSSCITWCARHTWV